MDLKQLLADEPRAIVERWCEQRSRAVPLFDNRILCRVLGSYPLYADARDTSLTPHLVLDGYWEMWVTQAIARRAKPHWNSIDVGANVGYFALLLAALTEGQVLAIEPQPDLAQCVRLMAAANGWSDRISVDQCLVSDAEAVSRSLYVSAWDLGSASVTAGEGRVRVVDAYVSTLDRRAGMTTHFVKLDIEGHEPEALAGASALLARDRPELLIEWCQAMLGAEPLRHIEPLVAGGYELCEVDEGGALRPVSGPELLARPAAALAMLWLSPKV